MDADRASRVQAIADALRAGDWNAAWDLGRGDPSLDADAVAIVRAERRNARGDDADA